MLLLFMAAFHMVTPDCVSACGITMTQPNSSASCWKWNWLSTLLMYSVKPCKYTKTGTGLSNPCGVLMRYSLLTPCQGKVWIWAKDEILTANKAAKMLVLSAIVAFIEVDSLNYLAKIRQLHYKV
jgi:hypothetical protein